MAVSKFVVAPLFLALALSACSEKTKDKVSPVAATAAGDTITETALETEMTAAGVPIDAQDVRQQALDRIVTRKVMAKAAREKGLDKTPAGLTLVSAAKESVEAGLFERSVTEKLAPPTAQEADAFVAAHPEMFANHAVYLVEQLRLPSMPDAALQEALRPLNTMESVAALLQARNVPFQRAVDQLDTLRADPRLSARFAAMKPGEVFVTPVGAGAVILQIRGVKPSPITGPTATKIATQILQQQKAQAAVAKEVAALKTASTAKITYSSPYVAPAAPAAPAPAKPKS